jgi:hypothetical protein
MRVSRMTIAEGRLSMQRVLDIPILRCYYTDMPLQKTSVQIDLTIRSQLEAAYPGLTFSEIVRLSLDYVDTRRPVLRKTRPRFQEKTSTGKD